jgi:hypothetical protein
MMCGRCDGEPYRGVAALFNGDLQNLIGFADREDWVVVSDNVIVYIGETTLKNDAYPLTRDCDVGFYGLLWQQDRSELESIGDELSRPVRAPNPNM